MVQITDDSNAHGCCGCACGSSGKEEAAAGEAGSVGGGASGSVGGSGGGSGNGEGKTQTPADKRILITSALPYVNNVPHLGNIVGCVLSADVYARYCRLKGYETLYICGTDEYGTATEIKAREEGLTPKEICDKYHAIHKGVYEWFGISFDYFGRTSTPKHAEITQSIFMGLYDNGYIEEEEVEQLYDAEAKMFLADRYVEGTCPKCSYEGARGDQCEKCGTLLSPTELLNPVSKVTKSTPIKKKTKHLFISLPKIEGELKEWIAKASVEGCWDENAVAITKGWLNEGLRKRAITRDLEWGVPVPLEGFEGKKFYVWFDAPIGYISITANCVPDWEKWWKNPDDVALYQFMGKDNVPFHTVVFPSSLIGSRQGWTLLHHISTTEFLNYEGGKFSKSRNTGVFGNGAMESGVSADVWRYYLIRNRPENADTNFAWQDFGEKNNNELVANLGNLVNRTLVFIKNNFEGRVPPGGELTPGDIVFLNSQKEVISQVDCALDSVKLKEGLQHILEFCKNANRYFQENAPWVLVKEDRERAATVLYVLANQVRDIGILCSPYLPETSAKIAGMLNGKGGEPAPGCGGGESSCGWEEAGKLGLDSGSAIGEPQILFRKIEDKEIAQLKERFSGGSGSGESKDAAEKKVGFSDLDLEVGEVLSVENHPDADRLYVEKVRMGGEEIQVVSGLAGEVEKEELLGKKVIIVKNLAPAKLRGVESQGMLLVVEGKEGEVEVLEGTAVGDKIYLEGESPGSAQKKQITFKEFSKVKLSAKGGSILHGEKKLMCAGSELKASKVQDGKVC